MVDDGSTDLTGEVVRRLGGERTYVQQARSGVSAARNRGAAEATAEYLAFLDADDTWLPDKLKSQQEAFGSIPGSCFCYGGYHITDQRLNVTSTVMPPEPEEALRRVLLFEPPVPWFASTGVVRADTFRSLGGFDEILSTSVVRIFGHTAASGWPGYVCPSTCRPVTSNTGGRCTSTQLCSKTISRLIVDKAFASDLLPNPLRSARRSALTVSMCALPQTPFRKASIGVPYIFSLTPAHGFCACCQVAMGGPR